MHPFCLAVGDVFESGEGFYVVTRMAGCAIWFRRIAAYRQASRVGPDPLRRPIGAEQVALLRSCPLGLWFRAPEPARKWGGLPKMNIP